MKNKKKQIKIVSLFQSHQIRFSQKKISILLQQFYNLNYGIFTKQ
ncbi:hypothetical protein pb186bvf_002566 [Paramecium bursaria]